jgi:hypothetical protein
MDPILTRCGYRCDLCLAYQPNVNASPSNRQKLSDGWYKYFGFRIPPEKIICDGCMSDRPILIDQSCPVRPCAIEKGLENCAQCELYGCEKLQQRIVSYDEVRARVELEIPEDDYLCFIQPYENWQRLEDIRGTLKKPDARYE